MRQLIVLSELNPSGLTQELAIKMSEVAETRIINLLVGGELNNNSIFSAKSFLIPRLNLISVFRVFFLVTKNILTFRPSLLYSSGRIATLISMPAAFICGVKKRIYTRHHSIENKNNLNYREVFLDKVVSRFSTNIVAVSKIVQDVLLDEGTPSNKVHIIPNGIEVHKFAQIRSSKKIKISGELSNITVGMLARNVEWKGIAYGIGAFRQLLVTHPKARLLIAGSPNSDEVDLKELLKDLHPSTYKIIVQHVDPVLFFAEIDVFMHLPVSQESEAFGLVFLEALAAGIPSVFTKSGVLVELIHLSGFQLVNYRDTLSTHNGLMRILENDFVPCDVDQLSQFEIQVMTDSYLKFMAKK